MPRKLPATVRAAREARIIELRRQRLHWDEIGAAVGVSASVACRDWQAAMARHPLSRTTLEDYRAEETELIDQAVRALMAIARDDSVMPNGRARVSERTRVEAWAAIRGWAERKARLLGLDAPAKYNVTTLGQIETEIACLEAELAS